MEEKMTPLTKSEVEYLLTLIEDSKVITKRKSDAATNRLKQREWDRITATFNETAQEPRTVHQLRLKWENLKKATRRRSAVIMTNDHNPGGKYEYIGPDRILDRVATILSNPVKKTKEDTDDQEEFDPDQPAAAGEPAKETDNIKPPIVVRPRIRRTFPKYTGWKRQPKTDDARMKRNLAIAEFYTAKKKLIDAKVENIQLHNEKLKLELGKLNPVEPIPADPLEPIAMIH